MLLNLPKQKETVSQSDTSSKQAADLIPEVMDKGANPVVVNQLLTKVVTSSVNSGAEVLSKNTNEVVSAADTNSVVHVQPVLNFNKGKDAVLPGSSWPQVHRNKSKGVNPFSPLTNLISALDPSTIDRGALMETKLKLVKVQAIANKIAINWKCVSNANNSDKARIMILWDPNILDVHIIGSSAQHVTCAVNSLDGGLTCVISSVYGFNHSDGRKSLWTDLSQIQHAFGTLPWLLCGDFNAMISEDEKLGGTTLSETDTRDFNHFIDKKTIALQIVLLLHLQGTPTENLLVLVRFRTEVEFLLPSFSDHSPAFISIFEDQVQVSSIWNTSIVGHTMFSVCSKLKLLKTALKDLNKRHFCNISEQVLRAKVDLENAQKALLSDPFNASLINQEKEKGFITTFNKLLECELSFYQQKARIKWNLKGDRCTRFFHSVIKSNRHQNRIMILYNNNGDRITEGDEIAMELVSYYKSLFGASVTTIDPDIDIIHKGPCLNDLQARELSKPVTKEEIRSAIFSMPDDKAPGPDGYNAAFYKSAWSIVGDEITQAIEGFFKSGKLLGTVNSTAITLIPKVKCPTNPAYFRPISCCNCIYKFISKILANRI
ncbi:uncharacterized protein LOC109821370 [Asparagus officinalis]|uniref:uncharacterized protein LOC109821370 n=1 Tax=Asparagus officinalis TaxID=4686 RepID=UPI00098E6B7C|nr:uncharacterized protein LOC109821370 [Asparagus officinalis]